MAEKFCIDTTLFRDCYKLKTNKLKKEKGDSYEPNYKKKLKRIGNIANGIILYLHCKQTSIYNPQN